MIRFRLKERIADFEFREGRHLTLEELSGKTEIHRTTLSRIATKRGYNTTTENINNLCEFFGCQVADLMEYVPDPPKAAEGEDQGKGES